MFIFHDYNLYGINYTSKQFISVSAFGTKIQFKMLCNLSLDLSLDIDYLKPDSIWILYNVRFHFSRKASKKVEMESIKYKMDTLINEKIDAEARVVQLRKEKETFDSEATRFYAPHTVIRYDS